MKPRITKSELVSAATRVGLAIQRDCGGVRVVNPGFNVNVFPVGGTCPTTTARECLAFLDGVYFGRRSA